MLDNYICALDIGSSKVCATVAEVKRKRITSIFFDFVPSRGMRRGLVTDSLELVGSIDKLLKNLRAKSGINIKFVYTNISGQDMVAKHSHVIIPLAERGNKVITLSDVHKVNEQARILGSNLEEEIIHQIPLAYSIDSKNNISNPLGLYSHRLEVDLYLICVKLSSLQTLTRIVSQAGYEMKDLFFSGLATSEVIFDKENQAGLNIVCDIGSDITELLVFKDGLLKDIEILPLGGDDLTGELQVALNIPFDLAEDVKRSHGVIGDYNQIDENKEILVKKSSLYKPIKQKMVSQILTSKTKSMCQAIKECVEKKVVSSHVDNFVTTGRTVLIEGFLESLESVLGIPIKLGRVVNSDIVHFLNRDNNLSGHNYLNYLTSLGIISAALKGKRQLILPNNQSSQNLIRKAINRVKEVYLEYF